ncbi:MAG: methyltransferase domain-containing protein [Anaerolineales bacterium]|nr:methyltransferase domain-containing protein [Anaerolineales bacterium]
MSKFTDQIYLKTDQYRDSSRLDARVELHRHFSTNPQGWFSWVFDALEKLPGQARMLELGCGTGNLWIECAERILPGWEITLSDLSEGMLAAAQKNLNHLSHPLTFKTIDVQMIPFDSENFDIVIANHMLYHVPDRSKALSEIWRVLKPGGYLIATTVGNNHLKELNAWLARLGKDEHFKPFSAQFTLENGQKQLQPFFLDVECFQYDDNLRITDIDLLEAYIRSTLSTAEFSEEEMTLLRNDLERELDQKGEIFVTKVSGLFQAVKQR